MSFDDTDPNTLPMSGKERLDLILQRNAAAFPERAALADDPDRLRWGGSPPIRVTYGEAERRVAAIAAYFRAQRLEPGAVVAMSAPNMVETVLVMLAAFRAELAVFPMPPLWRWRDALPVLSKLQPQALITTGTLDGEPMAPRWRGVLSELASVHLQAGFGAGLPPDFHDLWTIGPQLPLPAGLAPDAADRVATVTIGPSAEAGIQLHARSHAHWLDAGAAVERMAGTTDGACVLLPYGLTGLTGIGAGLVPWLRSGGTLHLHHYRTLSALTAHTVATQPHVVVVPGLLAGAFAASLVQKRARPHPSLIAVWKDRHGEPDNAASVGRVIDLTVLDDLAFVAERRRGGAAEPLPLGAVAGGTSRPGGLELRVEGGSQRAGDQHRPLASGVISVRGAMVPPIGRLAFPGARVESGLAALPGGYVRTATACRLVDGPAIRPDGRQDDHISVNGIPVPAIELDRLYGQQEDVAEAACFVTAEGRPRIGAALVVRPGATVGTASFNRSLNRAGASLHHLPEMVVVLQALPRRGDGRVDRDRIAELARLPAADVASAAASPAKTAASA